MPRRNPVEHQRRVNESIERSRRYPAHSLTDEQREDLHRDMIARGWKEGKRRQHPTIHLADRCVDCFEPCEPTDDPLDRLCDRCRSKRSPG
jgi:hypothetical protein